MELKVLIFLIKSPGFLTYDQLLCIADLNWQSKNVGTIQFGSDIPGTSLNVYEF